jgi:hypothetical protein
MLSGQRVTLPLRRTHSPDTCVSARFQLRYRTRTCRNYRSTPRDSILPLTRFPFYHCRPLTSDCCVSLILRRGRWISTSLHVPAWPVSSSLARFGKLTSDCVNLENLSKNECVFTPSISKVNKFVATLSSLFSIECSASTGTCQNFVQFRIARKTYHDFTRYFRGFHKLRSAHTRRIVSCHNVGIW